MTDLPDASPAGDPSQNRALVRRSLGVAGWTVVSRGTGLARLALVAAVLGPTYLGNTFQATNQIPTLAYQVLVGSLLSSLLVPPLVRALDTDLRQAERLAGSLLGLAVVLFAVSSILLVIAGPVLLRVLSSGVEDPAIAAAQRRAGWILLLATAPQVLLYGVASVAEAALFARDKFALAAAAPSLENIGLIITLASSAVVFGVDVDVDEVRTSQLLLLGLGSTAGVAVHAFAKWWGAWKAGIRLVPNAGWATSDVHEVVRRALPTMGYAVVATLLQFLFVVVANSVAGGVIAFHVGLQLMYFPVAITARSVSVTLLPVLSRLASLRDLQRFRDALAQGVSLTLFVAVPAAFFYAVLAGPIASAAAFGEMATPRGIDLLTVSVAALSAGLLGEAVFVVSTLASYARDDTRSPFEAMVVRAGVTLVPAIVALAFLDDAAVLMLLGLGISAANLVSAWHLGNSLRATLPALGEPVVKPALRALGAAALMVVPARAVTAVTSDLFDGRWSHRTGVAVAAVTGAGVYLLAHRTWRSPELASWISSLRSPDHGVR